MPQQRFGMEGKMLFHHVIHNLEDWGQVFQDRSAFEPLIREIFRRHGLPFSGVTSCTPGSNAVFRCGASLVKIFAPEESGIGGKEEFLTERFGLLRAKRMGIPAPELFAQGVIEDAYPFYYLLMEYVEGKSLADLSPQLSGEERVQIGCGLRRIVERMDVPCAPFNGHMLFSQAAEKRWKAFPASFRDDRKAYLEKRVRENGKNETAGAGGKPGAAAGPAVYVHGDLNPDNILIRPDGSLCLIDFADALVAPIELELAGLLCDGFRFDPDYRKGFFGTEMCSGEELTERLLFGLLIHDYGANIIRDNIGAAEQISSVEELRKKIGDR